MLDKMHSKTLPRSQEVIPDLRDLADVEQFRNGAGGWTRVPRIPHIWASIVLATAFTYGEHETIIHWRDLWRTWEGSHWRTATVGEISAIARPVLATIECLAKDGDDTKAATLVVDRKIIAETLAALADMVRIADDVEPYTWRNFAPSDPDPANVVVFLNGLFDLDRRQLLPADPRFMATGCNGVDYKRPDCPEFHGWLKTLWADQHSRDHLQEVIGYLISGDRSLQKIPALIGPPRSGKSIVLGLVSEILGTELATTLGTSAFGSDFGLAGLVGKRVGMIADLRLNRQVDRGAFAERLLTFSGQDRASIPQKYREDWRGMPTACLCYAANQPLVIGDDSSALPNRTVPVVFEKSFLGCEDTSLFSRIASELPGIALWAAHGLARLRKRGRFDLTPAGRQMLSHMVEDASPTAAFVRECCEVGSDYEVLKSLLYESWTSWSRENHIREVDRRTFGRSLRSALPGLREAKRGPRGAQYEVYLGIRPCA